MCRPGPYNAPQRKLLSLRIALCSSTVGGVYDLLATNSPCGSLSTNPDIKFVRLRAYAREDGERRESRARPGVRMRPAVGPFGKAFGRNSVCWMICSKRGRTA